jgi:O-antigen ligase
VKGYAQPKGIWIFEILTVTYLGFTFLRAQQEEINTYLFLRDSAFFVYILMLPGVIYLLKQVSDRAITWLLRISALFLALWLSATFLGWNSSEFGAQVSENLFAINADIAGIVLAIGIFSWDKYFGLKRSWLIQALMLFVGLQLQSRVGSLSVVIAWLLVILGIKSWRNRLAFVMLGAAAVAITILTANLLPGQQVNRLTESPLPGLIRVLPSDASSQGTNSARIDTWSDIVSFQSRSHSTLFGSGPGSNALDEACKGSCLVSGDLVLPKPPSGISDLRYPHNIELSMWLYHGLLGILLFAVWISFLLISMWMRKPTVIQWAPVALFFGAAQVGVVLESPFGLVPFVFFSAWALAYSVRPLPTRKQSGDP